MKAAAPERAVIVGLGSIGKRHLVNLRELCPETQIAVWRHRRKTSLHSTDTDAPLTFFDLSEVRDFGPNIAIVANPASQHISVGAKLAAIGAHLLIEKPLAATSEGIEDLIADCARRALVLMTGYTLRFDPALRCLRNAALDGAIGRLFYARAEVGSYLADWRPGSDYRQVVSAAPELGGGAVLELSHELDYIRWICGEVASVSASVAKLSDLEINVEDTAEITLQFRSGVLGSVHLDMVQRPPVRKCELIGSDGRLEWDALNGSVVLLKNGSRPEQLHATGKLQTNDIYQAELGHFLECVAHGARPLVTGEDGLRVVELAEAVKRSSSERRSIDLPTNQ